MDREDLRATPHSDQRSHYQTVFDAIEEAFVLCEAMLDSSGKVFDYWILEANAAFAEQSGMTDPVGKLASALGAIEPSWFNAFGRAALERETFRYENYSEAAGRWIETFMAPAGAHELQRFIAVFRDVTARKRAELTAHREEFRTALLDRLRSSSDPLEVQTQATRMVGEHLGVSRAMYIEVDDALGVASVPSQYVQGVAPFPTRFAAKDLGPDFAAAFAKGDTVVSENIADDPRLAIELKTDFAAAEVGAFCGVPIVKRGQLVAIFGLHHHEPRRFNDADHVLLKETAEQTWSAVERALAETALREREAQFEALFNAIDEGFCVCEIVTDERGDPVDYRFLEVNPHFEEMTGLVDAVGKTAYEMVPNLERKWIDWYGRVALGGETLRFEDSSASMGRRFEVFSTPTGQPGRFSIVFKDVTARRQAEEQQKLAADRSDFVANVLGEVESVSGSAERLRRLVELLVPSVGEYATVLFPNEVHPSQHAAHGESPLNGESESLVVPLPLGRGVTADLVLHRTSVHGPYTDDDRIFVKDLADRVSLALAAARVREEEHGIALGLQRALLPDDTFDLPGVALAARYEAGSDALEVGGDWFDAFSLPNGKIGLCVGDVVGHGLEAAAAMGRLRIGLSALAPHAPGPGVLLSQLDEFSASGEGVDFATAVYAIFDPENCQLRYASAGHPPMLLVERDGSTKWLDGGRSGPITGVVGSVRLEAEETLSEGSSLLLYSDGLIERRREPLSMGLKRLESTARELRYLEPAEYCDELVARPAIRRREDDVVALCLRVLPTRVAFRQAFPAVATELRNVRQSVRAWLNDRKAESELASNLILAIGEACANAVEHGYRDIAIGSMEIEIEPTEVGAFLVTVRDFGQWRPALARGARGHGTGIMQKVTEDFSRIASPEGTTVTFRVAAGANS